MYQVIRLRWRRSRSKGPTKGYPICTVSVSEKKAINENEIEPISVMGCPGTEDMIRASALALWTSAHLGKTAQDYLLANGVNLETVQKVFSQHGFTLSQIMSDEQTEVFLLTSN